MDGLRARRGGASQLADLDTCKPGEIRRASSAGALVAKEAKDTQPTQPGLRTRSFSLRSLSFRKVKPDDVGGEVKPKDAKSSIDYVCATQDAHASPDGRTSSKPDLPAEDEDKMPLKLPEIVSPQRQSCTTSTNSFKRSLSGLTTNSNGSDNEVAYSKTLSSETTGSVGFTHKMSSASSRGTLSRSIDFLRGAFTRRKQTGDTMDVPTKRRVCFNDKAEERCVTPYSLKYGRPLKSFVFSRSGMVESMEARKSKEKAVEDLVAAANKPMVGIAEA